jgi:hypothetical protein
MYDHVAEVESMKKLRNTKELVLYTAKIWPRLPNHAQLRINVQILWAEKCEGFL